MPADPNRITPLPSSRRHRWPYLLVLCASGFAGWGVLRSRSHDSAVAVDPAEVLIAGSAKGFNLLFVTLDTTRVDHLGCYGYEHAQTPTIDGLAASGVRFDDAVTSVPLTLPSHAVMMTGKYPPELGVRVNGNKLGDEHTTLAEILSSNGYATAAFVGAFVLDRRWGIAQGFDTYDFQVGTQGRKGLGSIFNERQADAVTASALHWLKQRRAGAGKAPFFMWLHYFDPHNPYESPLANLPQFEGRPYDAEIAMADTQLGHVLDWLEKNGLRENTLVVFATDHGEGFFDKDEARHGVFLYESTLRVGIILSNPKLFSSAGRVDDRVVGTVDLLPTILELLALSAPSNLAGRSLISPRDEQRGIYIETKFPLNFRCAPLYGLRRHRDKFINAPEPEYYEVITDAREAENIYAGDSAIIRELRDRVLEVQGQSDPAAIAPVLSQEDVQALGALGYAGQAYTEQEGLPDPKAHIHVINQLSEVHRLKEHGALEEALALAVQIAEQSEVWNMPIMSQAEVLSAMGRLREAAELLRKYAERYPQEGFAFEYAQKLFLLNEHEKCLSVLETQVFTGERELGKAHMLAGDCYRALGRLTDARAAYEKAHELDADQLGDELIWRLRQIRDETP